MTVSWLPWRLCRTNPKQSGAYADMSFPTIALVGRPNVGKSTLFNRLTKTRDALVADFAGLTRDRKYGEATIDGRRCLIVDTGGVSGTEDGVGQLMAKQAMQAVNEANLILFIVDSREGVNAADIAIANQLRKLNKSVLVVANKVDGLDTDIAIAPFHELALGEVVPISAAHGRGMKALLQQTLSQLPDNDESKHGEEPDGQGIKIAVVGRPNVGKSTLVNRLLGEERVVVYDLPGTTRDSIYVHYQRHGKNYTLIDTAGVRKRKHISLAIEKFSIVKTLQAIDDANVVILLIDGQEGLVEQDMHLLGSVIEAGRALVVAINKWDGLDEDQKNTIKRELDRRLRFAQFADLHFISALHGTGVGHLYKSIEKSYAAATHKFNTNALTAILQGAVTEHQPPMICGRRIKLRYAHIGGHNPPIIVIHGNQTEAVPDHYTRYLEKVFRRELKLHGTPVRIQYKSSENPFAGKKNTLTSRQLNKRQRMMQHLKKSAKKKRNKR